MNQQFNEFNIETIRTSSDGSFSSFSSIKVEDISDHSRGVDMVQYNSMSLNEISNIPPEAVGFVDHGLNSKYKSIAVMGGKSHFDEYPKHIEPYVSTRPPKLSSESKQSFKNVSKLAEFEKPSSGGLKIPPKPFYIANTHFLCVLSIYDIISRIQKKLDGILEVSYQFVQHECMWEAVYLRGSSYCKFQLHVFKEDDKSSIIEGNRLSGDGFPFRRIYDEIKADLLACDEQFNNRPSDSFNMSNFSSGMQVPNLEPITDSQATEAIKPIIQMAKSNMIDSQFEASAILCDLSLQEDMQQILCDSGCVKVLMDLLCVEGEFQSCNYHAICALANLSSSAACQDLISTAPQFINSLLKLVADGPYYSAELRRESARVLANVCDRHSSKVLKVVDSENIRSWMNGVEDIQDERLRTHANRAKLALSVNAVY